LKDLYGDDFQRANKKLLEHWQRLRDQGAEQRLEGELGAIISETLPSPDSPNKVITSAQLMDTWLAATNLDPRQLEDLEKELNS
jgi:hypothetical protein